MPIGDIVQVVTLFQSPPAGVPSLNTVLAAAVLTAPQDAAWDAAFGASVDVTEINGGNYRTVLDTLGVTAGEDLEVALSDLFSQSFNGQPAQPSVVILARRATPVAQVVTVTINGDTDGTFTHTINGVDFSFVAVAQTTTQIRDGLIAAINGGSEPVTAAPGAGDSYTVTADEAGVSFTSSVNSTGVPADISQATTTASSGIAQDIDNWSSQDDRWTWILETTRSQGVQTELAVRNEAGIGNPVRPRFVVIQTNDPLAQDGGSTDDLASRLGSAGLALTRTAVVWHDNDDQFVDWALVGRQMFFDPGVPNWVHVPLASVTGIQAPVLTSTTVLTLKRYSFLVLYTSPVPPVNSTRGGQFLDGNWIDIIHGVAALNLTIQIRVYDALRAGNVPYTGGEPTVSGAVLGALKEFEGLPGVAFLVEGESSVSVPDASTQDAADVLDRRYAGVTYSALAQGKVNTVSITGFLQQGGEG